MSARTLSVPPTSSVEVDVAVVCVVDSIRLPAAAAAAPFFAVESAVALTVLSDELWSVASPTVVMPPAAVTEAFALSHPKTIANVTGPTGMAFGLATAAVFAVLWAARERARTSLPAASVIVAVASERRPTQDPIQTEGERILRENPDLRARLEEYRRKRKAGEPLNLVEHQEVRRRLAELGVPLEDD